MVNLSTSLTALVEQALAARSQLFEALHQADTNLYRVFHGATEGHPGLTVDRYGPNLLIQSWRESPSEAELREVQALVNRELGQDLGLVCYDRSKRGDLQRTLVEIAPGALVGSELGVRFDVELVHRGIDPLLFLDFRVARRLIRERAANKSVLNLFAYTCGIGVAAAVGGAREVLNVDFAQHALDVGRRNAELNQVNDTEFRILREDCIPVLRQLSGLGVKGKAARRTFTRLKAQTFDLVVLDPPRLAKSPFGLVDTVNDYQSLFKPALLSTKRGGELLVTNNVANVELDKWVEMLKRCALKAEREIANVEIIEPECDFRWLDGKHPLKMAWLTLG